MWFSVLSAMSLLRKHILPRKNVKKKGQTYKHINYAFDKLNEVEDQGRTTSISELNGRRRY